MAKFELRRAVPADVKRLYRRLRKADMVEIMINKNSDPYSILMSGVKNSTEVWAYLWDGKPESLVGVIRQEDGSGVLWQLGSDEIDKHPRRFVTETLKLVERWRLEYPLLHNFVGVNSMASHRYIEWLGFIIDDTPVSVGENEVKFYYFFWRRDNDVQS